jgi:hypothetical protein
MSFSPMKRRNYGTPKEVVARLFEQAGGVPTVMEILELSRTRVYAMADPDDDSEISFSRVAKLTQETQATAAAEHLALSAHGLYLPVGDAEPADWHAIASKSSRSNARTIATLLDALSNENPTPGTVDAQEARLLIELVDKQIALLAFQRSKLMEIAAEGAED